MQTTSDLHGGACLLRLGWPLLEICQGVCTYCIATQWPFHWERNQEEIWVSITFRGCPKGFWSPETGVYDSPVLAFADSTKPFLLEMDASKDGLGAVLSQMDGWYHPVTFGSRALTPPKKNYHLTKLEFLALKWAVTKHFKEYLFYQPFLVKTGNNPLTYIMTTPNLDATGHWWVGALVQFNLKLEYQKGHDNTVADVLSQVTTQLNPTMVRSILYGVVLRAVHQAEVHDPTMIESDHCLEKEVHVTAGHALVQMNVTD